MRKERWVLKTSDKEGIETRVERARKQSIFPHIQQVLEAVFMLSSV